MSTPWPVGTRFVHRAGITYEFVKPYHADASMGVFHCVTFGRTVLLAYTAFTAHWTITLPETYPAVPTPVIQASVCKEHMRDVLEVDPVFVPHYNGARSEEENAQPAAERLVRRAQRLVRAFPACPYGGGLLRVETALERSHEERGVTVRAHYYCAHCAENGQTNESGDGQVEFVWS